MTTDSSIPESRSAAWRAGDAEEVIRRARLWLASDILERLLRKLGAPSDVIADQQRLRAWTSVHLDTRRGAERQDAAPFQYAAEQIRALIDAGGPLGLMATPAPTRDSYDAIIILGGATTGNRLRAELARDLVGAGLQVGEIVALTADRPLGAVEVANEPDSAADETEWRNLRRYLLEAFGPLQPAEGTWHGARAGAPTASRDDDLGGSSETGGDHITGPWDEEILHDERGIRLRVLVAPGSDPGRRATTADAIRFYLRWTAPKCRGTLLLVTSAIYVPYQFFRVAPPLLADSAGEMEMIGTPTRQDDPALLAQRLAQEIHAAIAAASALIG